MLIEPVGDPLEVPVKGVVEADDQIRDSLRYECAHIRDQAEGYIVSVWGILDGKSIYLQLIDKEHG